MSRRHFFSRVVRRDSTPPALRSAAPEVAPIEQAPPQHLGEREFDHDDTFGYPVVDSSLRANALWVAAGLLLLYVAGAVSAYLTLR